MASRAQGMSHYTPGPVTRTPFAAPLAHAASSAARAAVVVAVLTAGLVAFPRGVCAAESVGAETCKACHPAAYDTWAAGPHARALEALPERSRKDRRCLSCHAPGLDDGVAAVSCESCHGPGRLYVAPYVMRDAELARALGLVDPNEKACAACHGESAPSLVKFDYRKKLAQIDHWSRERRDAAPPQVQKPTPAAKEH